MCRGRRSGSGSSSSGGSVSDSVGCQRVAGTIVVGGGRSWWTSFELGSVVTGFVVGGGGGGGGGVGV